MNAVVLVLATLEAEDHCCTVADIWPLPASESRILHLCMVRLFGYSMDVAV